MAPTRETLTTRRNFLNRVGLLGLAASASHRAVFPHRLVPRSLRPREHRRTLRRPSRIAPRLLQAPFTFSRSGSIRPSGWLEEQFRIQANGLSGHLDETWADVGPNSGWLGGTGESWERGPYFLDGLIPLAYLLDDRRAESKGAEVSSIGPSITRRRTA